MAPCYRGWTRILFVSAYREEQTVRKSSKGLRTAKLLTQGLWELEGGGDPVECPGVGR